jgi:transcriptional regulator NrdR family protein
MTCPWCKRENESKVLDSRPGRGKIRRRRECLNCGRRFTTVEHVIRDPDFDSLGGVMSSLEAIQQQVTDAMRKAREIQSGIGA